jgi:CarD family transcriptional regulator
MSFKINEIVFYPSHGVAVIEDIAEKNVGGAAMKFYKLSFLYKDMTVLVPVTTSSQTGVRALNTPDHLEACLAKLSDDVASRRFDSVDVSPAVWSKRQRDYQTRVQTGEFAVVLSIYQELMFVNQSKELSFGEKALLHTAEDLLAQELMVVRGLEHSDALELIRAPFKQFVVNYGPQGHQRQA